jgi:hypothetical protein
VYFAGSRSDTTQDTYGGSDGRRQQCKEDRNDKLAGMEPHARPSVLLLIRSTARFLLEGVVVHKEAGFDLSNLYYDSYTMMMIRIR